MDSTIHILLPVHNRLSITQTFITTLANQTFNNYHLILIDDGSTDGTAEYAKYNVSNLTIIKGNGKLWWAGSLQKGHEWIKHYAQKNDYVLIINDDTHFNSNYLEQGIANLPPGNTILFSRCYDIYHNKVIDSGIVWNWEDCSIRLAENDSEINCCSTRGLLMTTSSFLEIGAFYPKLLPHYLSDYEFTMRAHQKGFKIITHPEFCVWTDESPAGLIIPKYRPFSAFLKSYFSPRNYRQPLHVFNFIMLACPNFKLKMRHWKNLAKEVIKHFHRALNHHKWEQCLVKLLLPIIKR